MQLAGSSVLVTGASGGIGKAIARALHARGARVIVSGRRTGELEQLRGELGGDTTILESDLADRDAVGALVERAGPLDVVVANAALPASGRVDSFTSEEIDSALDVNLRAPIQLAHARRAGDGRARARAPGLHLLPVRQGRERRRGHLLGHEVRPARLRRRAQRGPDRERRGRTTVFPGFISDAGMFAEAGTKLPPGVGTRTPEAVADAVVRGIEDGKAELDVAPLAVRVGARPGASRPRRWARSSGGWGRSRSPTRWPPDSAPSAGRR